MKHVFLIRNVNLGQRGQPSTADLLGVFAAAGAVDAVSVQSNGTVIVESADASALAEAVDAKAFLKAPAPVLKIALGGLSDELLGSLRLEPMALSQSGFRFDAPDIASTLELGLKP